MDTSAFDVGFCAFVVQTGAFKSFRWDGNCVWPNCIIELELWLDSIFPFIFHDRSDAVLAQIVPLATQSILAHGFKGFINEDAPT